MLKTPDFQRLVNPGELTSVHYTTPKSIKMAFNPAHFQPYGHCDSYFVENHDDDDGLYARAAVERETQRGVARLRQKALAEELSRHTASEYQEDFLKHMERMEVGWENFLGVCCMLT